MGKRISVWRLIFVLVIVALLVSGATFAFWTWTSDINKNVVFTTADLEDYVVYDEGNSSFVGNFLPSDTYCESVNTTLSFYKKEEAIDIPLYATIKMDLNNIGENTSKSNDVYWVVTTGDNTVCEGLLDSENVLAYGTFNGTTSDETLKLVNNIEIGLTEQKYTVWVWIDNAGTDLSNLSGETIDVNVWTEITMKELSNYDDHTLMITSYMCKDESGNDVMVGNNPYFTYTGRCEVLDDGNGDWRIRFLTSGTFTTKLNIPIDIFLVGGGGGGGTSGSQYYGGGGGGGGYVNKNFTDIYRGEIYEINIGLGGEPSNQGETTAAFDFIAAGGNAGNGTNGGAGGSGGGGGSWSGYAAANGGSNGANGGDSSGNGGLGGGITTREFGEENGDLYAGGGGGGGGISNSSNGNMLGPSGSGGAGGGGAGGYGSVGSSAENNTGGGGGGGSPHGVSGGSGGSGIAIIRNLRYGCGSGNLDKNKFKFVYSGHCVSIDDGNGNWRIKFISSGTLKSFTNIDIDAFLVGGGGGGGTSGREYTGGGGGGGGYTKTIFRNIETEIEYEITIGAGGVSDTNGESTVAFGSSATGGFAGNSDNGGSGGSGGGGGSWSGYAAANGGSNGANGGDSSGNGGLGGGITTREFGEENGELYAGGGGGGAGISNASNGSLLGTAGSGGDGGGASGGTGGTGGSAVDNTGGGGGGGSPHSTSGGSGGSGIVVIRNAR